MSEETNAGYTITDRLVVGECEFVIGQRDTAPAQFVTWQCKKGEKNYFWGHYLNDRLAAVEDLCKRAINEIEYIRSFQREKNSNTKSKQQSRRQNEPER